MIIVYLYNSIYVVDTNTIWMIKVYDMILYLYKLVLIINSLTILDKGLFGNKVANVNI